MADCPCPPPRWRGPLCLPRLYANETGECYVHADGVRVCASIAVNAGGEIVLLLRDADSRRAMARGSPLVAVRWADLAATVNEIIKEIAKVTS